ncbi:MAG: BON domain-containing protein [Chloroflexi bacterium]|nr:BON domain-containing protein [Chloroflexota bacterium]
MSVLWTTFAGGGGLRTHGGAYSPEFIATGLPSDEEITEMVYDAFDIDPLIPYDADLDVEADAGVVTLSGSVPNKRAKHSAGDDAWRVPGVTDVRNNITISPHRRVRTAPKE